MTIQEFKKQLQESGLPEESLRTISEILDGAQRDKSLTSEHKAEIKSILEAEASAAEIEIQALEETATALEDYAKEVGDTLEEAEEEITKVEEELTSEIERATQ
ncbi:MAG: hypothetical protein Q8P99_01260 [bacterium]|nr:hypothetical protein [bacterium]